MPTVRKTALEGVRVLEGRRYGDERGSFEETWRDSWAELLGVDGRFVQHNRSISAMRGTLRGLHFQRPPRAQGKLIRVGRGAIQDVAVDLREGSATYGQSVSITVRADTPELVWVPPGFAHGFLTLTDDTEVNYLVTDYYDPDAEGGLRYNDSALNIEWTTDITVITDRDRDFPSLAQVGFPFSRSVSKP